MMTNIKKVCCFYTFDKDLNVGSYLTVRIVGFYDMKERKMITENSSSRGPT